MRRKDREITDPGEMLAMLGRQSVCRIAFHSEPYPAIVPLNYGMAMEGEQLLLYFHCAKAGEKLDLMRSNPHVAFEVDGAHSLIAGKEACGYAYAYESVIGQGLLAEVSGEEKRTGLAAIMRQQRPDEAFTFPDAALDSVAVLRLTVARMTAKARRAP